MNASTSAIIAAPDAPMMVLFGGSPIRRAEVLELIRGIGGVTAYGALSEEEGLSLLATLPRVDLVLIGGRYAEAERERICAYVATRLPGTRVSEPGWAYPYDNDAIVADIRRKLHIE